MSSTVKPYQRFFETHVDSGVLGNGFFKTLPTETIQAFAQTPSQMATFFQSEEGKALGFSREAVQSLSQNIAAIANFADKHGGDRHPILFTQDGHWYVPPKMRDDTYLEFLRKGEKTAGTAALTRLINRPLPVYDEHGEQIGGFEEGDEHVALSVTDKRTGKPTFHEAQASYLENGSSEAGRPICVAHKANGLTNLQNPSSELDGCGMVSRNTSYAQHVIPDPHHDSIWELSQDGKFVKGANYSYHPQEAVEVNLNHKQMSVLRADMELSFKESEVKPEAGCTLPQNHPDFKAKTVPAFFPDGKEQWVVPRKASGEDGVDFSYATPDAHGKLPKKAQRVEAYEPIMPHADMQIVKPYAHHGNMLDSHNCFTSTADYIEGVGALGEQRQFHANAQGRMRYDTLPASAEHPSTKLGFFDVVKANSVRVGKAEVTQAGITGEAVISKGNFNGAEVRHVDFSDLAQKAAKEARSQRKVLARVKARTLPENALVFQTGASGDMLEQCERAMQEQRAAFSGRFAETIKAAVAAGERGAVRL